MPKVSEQYVEDKKNYIMDCAEELMKEIPLYRITMRDIIKKAGCSQGLIYRYYNGVDEIYADLMNREIRQIDVKHRAEDILQDDASDEEKIHRLFDLIGTYILEVQEKIGGKFYYEIQVIYAFDEKKQRELLPTLTIKQNLMYLQSEIVRFVTEETEKGFFAPQIPIDTLVNYAGASVDGIGNYAAMLHRDGIGADWEKMRLLFQMLGDYVIRCLRPKKRGE